MQRIDAHVHFAGDHPAAARLLEELDVAVLNISVALDPAGEWRTTTDLYQSLTHEQPARFAWCTTFDPYAYDQPGYADRVIAGLNRDIERGAVACKVWKNVGMELRRADGSHVMPDDAVFDPIYRHLAERGLPLLTHIGEPKACWLPLDPASPHYAFYKSEPSWHMHGRTDMPSHEALVAARDRVVERHSELRVIGAHLGSLEYDLDELAARLRRYPNFAVDVSARTADLSLHDTGKVRDWFHAFADRILWGTDAVMMTPFSQLSEEQLAAALTQYREGCAADAAFYGSDAPMPYASFGYGPVPTHGLNLPADVLEKFYRGNALRWYPGLRKAWGEA